MPSWYINKYLIMLSDLEYILKDKYKNKINDKNIKSFVNDLVLISKNYPRDYIIGYVDFLNCKIDLSKKPLIPRVETEYWLNNSFPIIKNHFKNNKQIQVLDIFSGSGCIGIAIAKNIKKTIVSFSDIDEENIKQIKINLKLNNIKNFKKVIKSDIFTKISSKYDLILANPPYVPHSDAIKAPSEPLKAIKAGKDGLDIIKPFLSQINQFLSKNGILIMEFHPNQVKILKTLLKEQGFNKFDFFKDQYNRYRYVIVYKLQ